MASPQFSIRLPVPLNNKLKTYVAKNGTTKTEVMIAALARYLDCETEVPLTQRMAELEARMTTLETENKSNKK